MGINTLGLTEGLNAAAQGLNSGYYGALGNLRAYGLAQQKQASETNLQNAQAGWYGGRNATTMQVADARRQGMIDAYKVRAQGQTDAATMNNMRYLPQFEQATAGQSPEAAAANASAWDQKFGTNLSSLFGGGSGAPSLSNPTLSGPSSGGPGMPQFNPATGSLGPAPANGSPSAPSGYGSPSAPSGYGSPSAPSGYGSPSGSPGMPTLPPLTGSPQGSPQLGPATLGPATLPPRSFSAPGIGSNAPPITGTSLTLPPLSGATGGQGLLSPPGAGQPSGMPNAPQMQGGPQMPGMPSGTGAALGTGAASGSAGTPGMPLPPLSNGPLKNPFSPAPLTTAKINALNSNANVAQGKMDLAFRTQLGITPPAQQPQMVSQWNARNGTNYSVPGTQVMPTLSNGQPALGPPSLTPSYSPNALQQATLGQKGAQVALDGAQANLANVTAGIKPKQFALSQLTEHDQNAYRSRVADLQAQHLSIEAATQQAQQEYQKGMLGLGQQRLQQGGSGVAGDALTMRMNQRLTALTSPAKDLMGNPTGAAMVTLDKNGNPSGVGAAEYRQLQSMLKSRPGGASGGNDMVTVNGITAPRAQWLAERARPGRH